MYVCYHMFFRIILGSTESGGSCSLLRLVGDEPMASHQSSSGEQVFPSLTEC